MLGKRRMRLPEAKSASGINNFYNDTTVFSINTICWSNICTERICAMTIYIKGCVNTYDYVAGLYCLLVSHKTGC